MNQEDNKEIKLCTFCNRPITEIEYIYNNFPFCEICIFININDYQIPKNLDSHMMKLIK